MQYKFDGVENFKHTEVESDLYLLHLGWFVKVASKLQIRVRCVPARRAGAIVDSVVRYHCLIPA